MRLTSTLYKKLIDEKPNKCRLDNSGERPRNYKNDDFYITTWKVRSLYGARMLKQNCKNKELILQQFKGYNGGEVEYWMQVTLY